MSGKPSENVAKNLAKVRRYRGISQADLAHDMTASGVPTTREKIANIETGRRADIGLDEWIAIAKCLCISPHLLLQEEAMGPAQWDDPSVRW